MKLRVMGAKLRVTSNISEHKKSILETIDEAANQRVDILITPEGSRAPDKGVGSFVYELVIE